MISIIIPCYNEGIKLINNIKKVNEYMNKLDIDYEIIVVNDGSTDDTYSILMKNISSFKNTQVESYSVNKGKGYAVKTGFNLAKGDIIIFMDADLSTDLKAINDSLTILNNSNFDIVIGNRNNLNSEVNNKSFFRKFLSNCCRLLTKIIIGIDFEDTQCGFKVFKKDVANKLYKKQKIDRFAFDIEYLYIAKLYNYKITEFPVVWNNDKDSKVRIVRDTIKFFKDILIIRKNKKYYIS